MVAALFGSPAVDVRSPYGGGFFGEPPVLATASIPAALDVWVYRLFSMAGFNHAAHDMKLHAILKVTPWLSSSSF
jgi:hypothetical protein